MDIQTLAGLAAQSPYLAALIVMGWVFNRYHIESLRERKEILQSLTIERQEATASRERLIERYALELTKSTEARMENASRIHALAGKMTETLLVQDTNQREIVNLLHQILNWARGQGDTNERGSRDAKS